MQEVGRRQATEREVISVGDHDEVADPGDWIVTFEDNSQAVIKEDASATEGLAEEAPAETAPADDDEPEGATD